MSAPQPALRAEQIAVFWRSSLFNNSLHLIAANAIAALLGAFFWIAAARLYPPREVGVAAAAISAIGLLAMFSLLGMDYAMIRFLPHEAQPQVLINSSLTIGSVAGLVLSAAFIAGLNVWSPSLRLVGDSPLVALEFIMATVSLTMMNLIGGIFVARKQAAFVSAQAVIFGGMKLFFVVSLAFLGHSLGMIGAWALALTITVICGVLLFLPRVEEWAYIPRAAVGWEVARRMTGFALANYLTTVLWNTPVFLLPLLVLNVAGPNANAYFYVASSVGGLLAMIPGSFSLSLFAHISQDEAQVVRQAMKSMTGTLWVLIPAISATFLLADKLLMVFGRTYSGEGTSLLQILALSTLPMVVNFSWFSVRRAEQRMGLVIVAANWLLVVTLGLSMLLLPRLGLVGVGISSLCAHGSLAVVIAATYLWRRRGSGSTDESWRPPGDGYPLAREE